MKKYSIPFFFLIILQSQACSQTIRVMTEQLTALGAFHKSLSDGYTDAAHGLQTIGGYQEEEYNHHKTYFQSLFIINKNILIDDQNIHSSIPQPLGQHGPRPVHLRPDATAGAGQGKTGVAKKHA